MVTEGGGGHPIPITRSRFTNGDLERVAVFMLRLESDGCDVSDFEQWDGLESKGQAKGTDASFVAGAAKRRCSVTDRVATGCGAVCIEATCRLDAAEQIESRIGYFRPTWLRVRAGYGLIAVPSHQRRSGPSRKIAKCRCGAAGSALPVLPT